MLVRLRLQNFRGFDEHELSFERLTLIVGRNNAGKSTIIEALRLVSLAVARSRTLTYIETPRDLRYVKEEMGFSPSMREIEFNTHNLFFRYGKAPAIIEATFSSLATLRIYINADGTIFCTLKNGEGYVIGSRQQARMVPLAAINILPQVSPLAMTERRLAPEYIKRVASLSTVLASSHFRNQLLIFNDKFERFREIAETNWARLRISARAILAFTQRADLPEEVIRLITAIETANRLRPT